MKKKKVAFIVTEYNEKVFYGGGEKVNSYIINELISKNYDVDIYTDISYVEKSDYVRIFIKDKNFEENYESILAKYDLVFSTNIEYISDITYSHNHSYIFEKQLLKIPFFYSNKTKLKKFQNALKNSSKISKIVVSSNIVKEDYIKNYKLPEWKVFVLPPAVDYREKKIKVLDKNLFVFGLVARGFRSKGGYTTLFAIHKLKKYCKNFKVKIINKNANKNFCIKFLVKILGIENYLEFLPLQDDMSMFYNSIDCLLVPSMREPYGLIVTEAMSFSKPVILSSVVGAKDLIKDNENGFVYDGLSKNVVKLLSEKMNQVLSLSQIQYSKLSENAWDTVKEKRWEAFAKDYINLAEQNNFENKIKVSVVIPIYNSEKYISKCLDSILNQTLKEIEVICVNDSSTDNTLSILEKYAKLDDRVSIITQKRSYSSSAPRNTGIKLARGEYIFFIDNDDYISQSYLEEMYRKITNANADIVINDNITPFYSDGKNGANYVKKMYPDGVYDITPAFIKQRKNNSLPWSKLYKLSVIKENALSFCEGYIYEDEHFYATAMPFFKKAVQCNVPSYFYRQHKASLMGQKSERKYEIFVIFKKIYEFYKEHNFLCDYALPYSILKYRSSQIPDYKKFRKLFLNLITELNLDINEIFKNKKLWALYVSKNKFFYRLNSLFYRKQSQQKISYKYEMLYEVDEE